MNNARNNNDLASLTTITAFVAGRTYFHRYICDYDTVVEYTVAKRTAKTVTMTNGKTYRINKWLTEHNGAESFYPDGQFSMAPVLSADRPVS